MVEPAQQKWKAQLESVNGPSRTGGTCPACQVQKRDNSIFIYSEIFKVGETSWQIKAWPSNKSRNGRQEDCLVFRLVSHNGDSKPTGTHGWKIKAGFCHTTKLTSKKRPLMTSDMRLFVSHSLFPFRDLTICVKIKVFTGIETTEKNFLEGVSPSCPLSPLTTHQLM